jgi:colicin import membrane protein
MDETAPRNELAPPPQGGRARALTLALLAHLLLVLALAWGLNWRRQASSETVQAELWSAPPPPVQAAPQPPQPQPQPQPDAAAQARQAEIALEQQKKAEAERQAAAQRQAEQQRQQELARQQAAEQARLQQQAAQQAAQKAAADARRQQEAAAAKARAQAQAKADADKKADAARRKAALDRLRQLAGGDNGGAPSAGYGDKVQAVVRPNIVSLDQIDGNPVAEVEVTTAPDGTITGRRLLKSSGLPNWDDAVLKAIDKTRTMPRDTDGRVPSPIILEFRPHARSPLFAAVLRIFISSSCAPVAGSTAWPAPQPCACGDRSVMDAATSRSMTGENYNFHS